MMLPTLTSARLRLRQATTNDVDTLHALWIDPAVRRFLWDDVAIPRAHAAAAIAGWSAAAAACRLGLWVVERLGDAALVGFVALLPYGGGPDAELLYGLAPAAWGQGLATEAAAVVLDWGLGPRGLARVVARADVPNTASLRVMARLGMIRVGREAGPAGPLERWERARG
ncbi:MAG: GNAT family N-acetyltransferase [bacterium]|nr:GNAT family N-acetyltransferase [bacterium]